MTWKPWTFFAAALAGRMNRQHPRGQAGMITDAYKTLKAVVTGPWWEYIQKSGKTYGWFMGDAEFAIDRAPANLESFPLKSPEGRALAIWLGGRVQDRCEGVPVDVQLKFPCRKAVGYDPMNGVSQDLSVTPVGQGAVLKGAIVRDWPLVIRFSER